MANPLAGEVALVIDGERRVLKLTLGALAELETALGADSLVALVERFEGGRFSARDVMALLLAGLHGGGHPLPAAALLAAEIDGGAAEAARAAGLLLARAFAQPGAGA
ncbi:MAG: gene transfer agent family protein [Rhodobacter sp.]|nr:gene transfer agent family protein [Paracoccaceae bacterium]MCC0077882.1 gene transfer agent family protein [Rhodobacter sp.]